MRRLSATCGILLLGMTMSGGTHFAGDPDRPLRIVASLFPLAEFAEAVAGDRADVHLLLPPGAEAHAWRPRPSDLIRISKADLFIYIGAELEPWAHDILESLDRPGLTVLEASRGLELLRSETAKEDQRHAGHQHEEHGAVDPHIWLDFQNDVLIVERILEILIGLSPSDSVYFTNRAAAYRERLRELDREYAKNLAELKGRPLVLGGHAAFGYLTRRYGLKQVALFGLSPDARPTPRQMIRMVEVMRENRVKVVFFEERVSDELARALAREAGAETSVLNPGANLSRKQRKDGISFLRIMRDNLERLKDGLARR